MSGIDPKIQNRPLNDKAYSQTHPAGLPKTKCN